MNKPAFLRPTREQMLAHLDTLKDEDIDFSDSPEWTPEMWANAVVVPTPGKEQIALRVDSDVLAWFKAQGPGYQTRMNAVLRMYMQAQNEGGR